MAVAVFGMYGLGLWMVDLDYYSPYYHSAPDLHRSIGMVLLFALVLRIGWRLANVRPDDAELSKLERVGARIAHWSLYALLLALMVSGYLMSTADGRPIEVFDWFSLPSLVQGKPLEKAAGTAHEIIAHVLIALVIIHSAAALKHHFFDRNRVLTRMWSGPRNS
jgi:cytochrome b561